MKWGRKFSNFGLILNQVLRAMGKNVFQRSPACMSHIPFTCLPIPVVHVVRKPTRQECFRPAAQLPSSRRAGSLSTALSTRFTPLRGGTHRWLLVSDRSVQGSFPAMEYSRNTPALWHQPPAANVEESLRAGNQAPAWPRTQSTSCATDENVDETSNIVIRSTFPRCGAISWGESCRRCLSKATVMMCCP